jgi:Flp pilus assembly protein protease CpaA
MITRFYFSHDRTTRWRLLTAVALGVVVMGYRLFLPNTAVSVAATRYAGYWLMLLTVVLFGLAAWEEARAHWPGWRKLRPHWPGLLAGVLVAVFWQVHEPHDFKVLFDEHVLGAIARVMHFEREGAYDAYAHYSNGHLTTLMRDVDKRPLMYPFLVSVVHDLTGFRPENSFVVNGLLGFALLMIVYGLGAAMGGWSVGCFGQLLLGGLPLLAQSATGGGFDLLNITAVALFFVAAWNYWRQPGAGGLDFCILSGVVLANCRYESLLFLGVLVVLALVKWTREGRISLTLVAALSPPLALPPILINQIFLTGGHGGFFQTDAANFLNLSHVPDNLQHAIYFLFLPDFHANNSILLSLVGTLALLLTLVWILRRLPQLWRETGPELPLLLVVLGALAETSISMLSFWGHWDDALVSRFSLPLQLTFALCAMFILARGLRGRKVPGWVIGGTALYVVVAAAPVSSEAYMTNEHQTYVSYRWARDYVQKHADNSVLIVTRASVMFALYGQPCLPIGIANYEPAKVVNVVPLGLYREVWVIQEFTINRNLNAWVEFPSARLDQRFLVKPIAEFACRTDYHIRISRVVGYDGTKPAGTVVLAGELKGDTQTIKEGLGGDYNPPRSKDYLLTQRPADEPAAIPMLTELPENADDMEGYLNNQYP